jgi:hypothetical protein
MERCAGPGDNGTIHPNPLALIEGHVNPFRCGRALALSAQVSAFCIKKLKGRYPFPG